MCWKIKQATKLLTSGNCILFCCLIPFSLFPFLFFFSKHFALKVRGGKKCRRVEKIEKLETNFKNFALTGRKKAQQTNYRKLIVERGKRGIDGQSDWMTERLTDNWTSVASQGDGEKGEGERRRSSAAQCQNKCYSKRAQQEGERGRRRCFFMLLPTRRRRPLACSCDLFLL